MPTTLQIRKGDVFRNRKTLNEYEVLALGVCCDNDKNNQVSVIYTSEGTVYTRCLDEFLEKMEKID